MPRVIQLRLLLILERLDEQRLSAHADLSAGRGTQSYGLADLCAPLPSRTSSMS